MDPLLSSTTTQFRANSSIACSNGRNSVVYLYSTAKGLRSQIPGSGQSVGLWTDTDVSGKLAVPSFEVEGFA